MKKEGGEEKSKGEGIRKTILFEKDVEEIITRYRRKRNPIPSFTKAVNEIIKTSKEEQ